MVRCFLSEPLTEWFFVDTKNVLFIFKSVPPYATVAALKIHFYTCVYISQIMRMEDLRLF